MKRKMILLLVMKLHAFLIWAQPPDPLKWWNPEENTYPVIEGRRWPNHEMKSFYSRLPARAEKLVRTPVWGLSRNAAGLIIRFKTNAKQLTVRYAVTSRLNMPHFSSTGASGLDLYSLNAEGRWNWSPGGFSFGDTITYRYDLSGNEGDPQRVFVLYLPTYNTVKWLRIGVPREASFTPLEARKERPVIVYGTSVTQGACASRPGMAWPSIVGRRLNWPFINLGFSGNGTLDKEMIDLINEVDAKAVILDCVANLLIKKYPLAEVKKRIMESVKSIRSKHPLTPVLLAAFPGIHPDRLDKKWGAEVAEINQTLNEAYALLKKQGVKNLYLLTAGEMHMGFEDTVDYAHATDLGLLHYAQAFEKALRSIFNKPAGYLAAD
ncbi:SGNH/GDSL hydrolase family protein [Niabella aurantiaca]|uniref:SGNH/GDSL hydrolase family protein n=1 Tax=Niabella aurantiaca TaxID=379900 RepID=UPI00035E3068|nr:SGNH/GDSL hydrolase family protein [Niabella aurantiaca]